MRMNILSGITEAYKEYQPLAGKNLVVCTHATEATAGLISSMSILGARIFFYPVGFSRNNFFVEMAKKDQTHIIQNDHELNKAMVEADIIIEDGARVSKRLYDTLEQHTFKPGLFSIEQTTNGIRYFQAQHDQKLWYPVVNVAESQLKQEVENALATPESVISSFASVSGKSLTQKNVMVLGYGAVGSGIAKLCRDHGSAVVVVEIDPVRRILAKAKGFHTVGPEDLYESISTIDILFSCTANHHGSLLDANVVMMMKDGALICNAGSGTGEISSTLLAVQKISLNQGTVEVHADEDHILCSFEKMGQRKTITLLCSGHPINLRYGKGTSTEVIDLVFSLILLTAIKTRPKKLERNINRVDQAIERELATYAEEAVGAKKHTPQVIHAEELDDTARPYGSVIKFGLPGEHLNRFSLARAVFRKGAKTQGHYHLTSEEAYFIEKGSMHIYLWHYTTPDKRVVHTLKSGDYLTIPQEYVHLVEVPDEDCECLVIASPPFSFWDQFFQEVQ